MVPTWSFLYNSRAKNKTQKTKRDNDIELFNPSFVWPQSVLIKGSDHCLLSALFSYRAPAFTRKAVPAGACRAIRWVRWRGHGKAWKNIVFQARPLPHEDVCHWLGPEVETFLYFFFRASCSGLPKRHSTWCLPGLFIWFANNIINLPIGPSAPLSHDVETTLSRNVLGYILFRKLPWLLQIAWTPGTWPAGHLPDLATDQSENAT